MNRWTEWSTCFHAVKNLARTFPSSQSRIGPLRFDNDSPESISDFDRSSLASSYWSRVWAKRSITASPSSRTSFLKDYNKSIKHELCQSVTLDDILYSITHSNNSTAGPDGIPFAAWRAAPELAAPILLNVFTSISKGQPPPNNFNNGLLFLLPKKQTGLISDTRPLSVTNTDNRIIAAAVAHKIMPAVLDIVDPAQKVSSMAGQVVITF